MLPFPAACDRMRKVKAMALEQTQANQTASEAKSVEAAADEAAKEELKKASFMERQG